MAGKNFSTNNASGKRRKSDLYETPYSMTEQLLIRGVFQGKVLEPACGNGAIVRMLMEKGIPVTYYDVGVNFLHELDSYESIITNPPFSLAFEFIEKAKEVCYNKFAFLLPLSYLHGQQRYEKIWQDSSFPLARVHVFTRYPMLGDPLRDDGKYRTGMMVYAWFVWDKSHVGPPQVCWIDNNRFILKKADV